MESTSSSCKTIYDVFLSFRGDTRHNFTSHLYEALRRENIVTFIDNELKRGENIDSTLMKNIEQSEISVIVFSKGYASSPYCLDELVKIIDCRDKMERTVLPIFYDVDPSDVEQLSGTFGDGFKALGPEHSNSTDKWKLALKEAAAISGWDFPNNRPETKLIDEVIKDIKKKIHTTSSYIIPKHFVGIGSQIEQVLPLLHNGSTDDVRVVGLWGMGGIGKTTIAEVIYSRISDQFDGKCFLNNVREELSKHGLIHVKNNLFSELLGDKEVKVEMPNALPYYVSVGLKRKKAVVVFDDVDESTQSIDLIRDVRDLLGPGSRVLVTSRDEQGLKSGHEIHRVRELKDSDALQLFSIHAFKQNDHLSDHNELVERMVDYAKGVPLALKVLGSHLCDNSTPTYWKDVLNRLERSTLPEIRKILEISYDGLEPKLKDIFLDIACFFKWWRIDRVLDIMNGCAFVPNHDFCSRWEIEQLQKKCLVTVVDENMVDMHDLIQEMGREVAEQQGSRLGNPRLISPMLTDDMGEQTVQGIYLDISDIRKVCLDPKAFSRMKNLRLIKFYRGWKNQWNEEQPFLLESDQSQNLECLPNMLRLFHWEEYPCQSLPSKFSMSNLVELKMPRSNITRLWDGVKNPQNLKRMDLDECRKLKKLSNLSSATNLKEINASDCESLGEIDSSISSLQKLVSLHLRGCKKLKMVPEIPRGIRKLNLSYSGVEEWSPSIQSLDHLHLLGMRDCKNITCFPVDLILNFDDACADDVYYPTMLDLRGCQNLQKLPEITGNLKEIYLKGTAIKELPQSIGFLYSLIQLDLGGCSELEILPHNICELKSLRELNLSGCSKLRKLPPFYGLSSLLRLNLGGTALEEIPIDVGICELKCLETLDLSDCWKLEKLPPLFGLSSLQSLYLKKCERLQALPQLPQQLGRLLLQDCTSLTTLELSAYTPPSEFHTWNENPQNLKSMHLGNCGKLNLEVIDASGCESLVEIDSSISSLPKLVCLCLTGCKKLKMVPDIPRGIRDLYLGESGVEEWSPSIQSLDNLRFLDMSDCKSITCFPVHLTLNFGDSYYTRLRLRGCKNLHKLPEITGNLKKMDLRGTAIKELPQSIGFLSSLIQLILSGCSELEILPHNICELKSLRELNLSDCSQLRKLPNLRGLSSLKSLDLGGTALEEIPIDVGICELKSLRELNLSDCSQLRKLPNLRGLSSLKSLDLGGTALEEIPVDVGICELKCLVTLDLRGCWKLDKLPPLFGLSSLLSLYLMKCKRLQSLPQLPQQLERLLLQNCTSLTTVELSLYTPLSEYDIRNEVSYCNCRNWNLEEMDLRGTAIKELPQSIGFLSSLIQLILSGCSELEILPHNICELKSLRELNLSDCSQLRKLPNLRGLSSLKSLDLGGTALEEIPIDVGICELKCLETLDLRGCWKLDKLPPLFGLSSLLSLYLMKCKRLQSLPQLPQQLGLLLLQNCTSLTTVELSLYTPLSEYDIRNEVSYCNCRNLNENARSNILSHAQFSLNQMTSQRNIRYYSTNVGVPGLEIPEWYRLQSQGSSISIPLKSSQINTEFLGFDVSIVVESNSKFYKTLYFVYECRIKNASGQQIWSFNCGMEMGLFASLESDHVFLWYNNVYGPSYYDLRDWLIENKSNVNEASFEFKAYGINNEDHDDKSVYERNPRNEDETLKIKKCGVNLMYDNEDKKWKGSRDQTNGSPTSDSLQQAEETNTALVPSSSSITIAGSFGQAKDRDTKKRTRESEEEESQPKRRKHLLSELVEKLLLQFSQVRLNE